MIGVEDKKTTVDKFRGLFDRGSVDEVPLDHAQDCLNVVFSSESRLQTRPGSSKVITVGYISNGVRRFFEMESLPPNVLQPPTIPPGVVNGPGLLILDSQGNLYIGDNGTPIKQWGGTPDFCAINVANRTYVSPSDGKLGFQLGRLQVVNPQTGSIRDAAGLAPRQSGTTFSAALGSSGTIPAGVHQFAVIYQTDTGFWTPPGPKLILSCVPTASVSNTAPTVISCTGHGMVTGESHQISGVANAPWNAINDIWHITRIDDNTFSIPLDSNGFGSPPSGIFVDAYVKYASVTTDGAHAVTLSNIPIGPAFVTDRLILATQAGGTEFFFVPNVPGSQSDIADNTTTTCSVNFFDTDLVNSADYLFDLLEVIPGGSSMCKYRGRLVIGGIYLPGNEERVILSNVSDPETFDYVAGYVQAQTERDGNNITNVFVLRDTLYMGKFTGTFSTLDNGGDPSSWAVSTIDAIVGAYNYGISAFTVTQPGADTGDIILVANRSGLFMFDGVMRRPELSWNIQHLWLRINFAYFYKVTVAHDPWNHLIYVSVPLDTATDPNTLLVCDYSDGRSFDVVRWSVYSFPWTVSCIGMLYFGSSLTGGVQEYTLKIGSVNSQSIRQIDPFAVNDDGSGILSYYVPGPLTVSLGALNCFKLLNFRAWGQGNFNLTISQEDGGGAVTPPLLSLAALPGRDLQRQINFTNEKMTVKFSNGGSGGSIGDYMVVDRLDVWGVMQWALRPSV